MHVIRLRGNWSVSSSSLSRSSPEGTRSGGESLIVDEPAQWLSQVGPDFTARVLGGRVRLARRFHSPTGIAPHDVVTVTFEHSGVAGRVLLDGEMLADFDSTGADQPILFSHDIRGKLQRSHELAIELEGAKLADTSSPKGDSPGDNSKTKSSRPAFGIVRLEIHPA